MTSQPGVFGFLLVAVAWFGLHLPALGAHGLWDPWEMDRAYVGRRMTDLPRALVVELRPEDGTLGPTARLLSSQVGSAIDIVSPDVPSGVGKATASRMLDQASELLDRDVYHVVLVDLAMVVNDPGSESDVEELAVWLERITARNPSTQFLLLAPLPREGDPAAAVAELTSRLQKTYAEVRVELAGRELEGTSWARTAPYRTELLRVLRASRDAGYRVFPALGAESSQSFLERGFLRAAEGRDLKKRMTPVVAPELVAQLMAEPTFALPAEVRPWPRAGEVELAAAQAVGAASKAVATPAATPTAETLAAIDAVRGELEGLSSRPWLRAEFKKDGVTETAPPLDAWLMAAAFSKLGVTEVAARLPFFMLGMFALFALFYAVRQVFGAGAATLAGLAMVTSPLFYMGARSVAGGMSGTAALSFVAAGFLLVVHRGRLTIGSTWLVLGGAALALFSQGIVGLGIVAVLLLVYPLAARDARLPVLSLPVIVAGLTAAVGYAVSQGSLFFAALGPKYPLFSWALRAEDRPLLLNFDDLLREIGFGAAPWSVLIPVAIGALLVRWRDSETSGTPDPTLPERPVAFVLLWLIVPYVLQSISLKVTSHLVYMAIPSVAVLVGIYLRGVADKRAFSAVAAVTATLLLALLIHDAHKSPEPLTGFLTLDPPLAGIKEDSDYPEAVKLPPLLLAAMLLGALIFFTHGVRLVSRVRAVLRGLGRPRALAILAVSTVGLLVTRLLAGLEGEIADAFQTRGGQMLEASHRLYVRDVFYWRPHHWALLVVAGAGALVLIAQHTSVVRLGIAWLKRWVTTSLVGLTLAVLLTLGAIATSASALPAMKTALATNMALSAALAAVLFGLGGLVTAHFRHLQTDRDAPWPWALAIAGALASAAGVTIGAPVIAAIVLVPVLARAVVRAPKILAAITAVCAATLAILASTEAPSALGVAARAIAIAAAIGPIGVWLRIPTSMSDALAQPYLGVTAGTAGALLVLLAGAGGMARAAGDSADALDARATTDVLIAIASFVVGAGTAWLVPQGRKVFAVITTIVVGGALVALAHGSLGTLAFPVGVFVPSLLAAGWRWLERTRLMRAYSPSPMVEGGKPPFSAMRVQWVHAVVGLLAGGAALALTLAWGTYDPGFVAFATVQSPLFAGFVAALLLLGIGAALARRLGTERLDGAHGVTALVARLAEPSGLGLAVMWTLAITAAGLTGQLFIASGLSRAAFLAIALPLPPEATSAFQHGNIIGVLVIVVAAAFAGAVIPALRRSAGKAFALFSGAAALVVVLMLTALCRKWLQLEPIAEQNDEAFLSYLFVGSRLTLATYAMVAMVAALAAVTHWRAIWHALSTARIERDVLAIAGAVLLAAGISLAFGAPRNLAVAVIGVSLLAIGAIVVIGRRDALGGLWNLLSRPAIATIALLVGEALLVLGARATPAALAALIGPVLAAVGLWFGRPLTGEAILASGGRALWRGVIQLLLAAPALFVPALVAAALGSTDRLVPAMLAGALVTGAFVGLHALLIGFRIGLGVSDVLGKLSVLGPAASIYAAVGIGLAGYVADPATVRPVLVLAGVGLAALAGIRLLASVMPLSRLPLLLERPRPFLTALFASALVAAWAFDTQLVTALSLHVSQKHLLDTLRGAEGGTLPEGRLFQHGLQGQSERNFYTSQIPEIRDQATALRVLIGEQDAVAAMTRPGSSVPRTVVEPGFLPANDKNHDGRRDAPAFAGVATHVDVEAHVLVDAKAALTPDAWKGGLIIDSDGWRFPVTSNTATEIHFDPAHAEAPAGVTAKDTVRAAPPFDPAGGPKSAYKLIAGGLDLDPGSTALVSERRFFLLPKIGSESSGRNDRGSFASLDFEYRKLTGGRHIPVLDDRSSRILLAASSLPDGYEDKNPIKAALIDEPTFVSLVHSGAVRGPAVTAPMTGLATWDGSLVLLGYTIDPWIVQRGKSFKMSLYFQVKKPVTQSYKLFVHADRGSNRIHTDHWPLAVTKGKEGKNCTGCFQTDQWMAGDIVVDTYVTEVPFGTPTGETDLFMGFFNPDDGDKRLKVTTVDSKRVKYNGSDDRPRIGSFVVR